MGIIALATSAALTLAGLPIQKAASQAEGYTPFPTSAEQ
jgi:hypothetical protein